MKPLWIELVNDGVANRFDFEDYELIEINWRLTKYPSLYRQVLKHELEHEEGEFRIKDLKHDMTSRTPNLYRFMYENPSSLTQLLPFYYSKRHKSWIHDWTTITSWGMVISIGICISWLMEAIF